MKWSEHIKHLLVGILILYPCCIGSPASYCENVSPKSDLERLQKAYPDVIKNIDKEYVYFYSGAKLPIDNNLPKKTFEDSLNNSSIRDMMAQKYTKGKDFKIPIDVNFDPGRIRNEDFFLKMYGENLAAIKKNLTTIDWFGKKVSVTKINKVNEKLLMVKKDLEKLPEKYHKFFTKTAGTFNYRKIAGTNRLSMHSFGIAIDINTEFSHYWRNSKPNKEGRYIYKNNIPFEIVEIFEKYGFIWGGKWYHYDTMHFEYRPELLI